MDDIKLGRLFETLDFDKLLIGLNTCPYKQIKYLGEVVSKLYIIKFKMALNWCTIGKKIIGWKIKYALKNASFF
jgi:hypothetical protein